nr:hypothetical protein CPBEC2_21100 [Clostridium perfringens]BDA32265.1 hypothetical protein CPBEC4_23650 [Clostridium perfringens]
MCMLSPINHAIKPKGLYIVITNYYEKIKKHIKPPFGDTYILILFICPCRFITYKVKKHTEKIFYKPKDKTVSIVNK